MKDTVREGWEIYRESFCGEIPARLIPIFERVFFAGAQSCLLGIMIAGLEEVSREMQTDFAMRENPGGPPN